MWKCLEFYKLRRIKLTRAAWLSVINFILKCIYFNEFRIINEIDGIFQCLVDYEGDSDEEDDEDNSHLSKKARIE